MKKKSGKMKMIYMIYLAVLLLLMMVFLWYARKTLILYEASQPKYLMDALIAVPDLTLSMNTAVLTFNEFETLEDYQEQLRLLLENNDLQYHFLKESYTDGTLTYGIYAGETPVGTAVLQPMSTTTRLIAIPITDWQLTALDAYEDRGDYSAAITVPSNYTVKINNIPLTDTYITERVFYEELEYSAAYVSVPEQVTYQVSGLKHPAQITVLNADGCELPLSDTSSAIPVVTDNTETSSDNITLCYLPAEEEISTELRSIVLDAVETYSNFFSRDLPGCRESVDPIRELFPEDSIYLTLADQYRREDMQIFSAHTDTHFLNESITEYIPYNDRCFSCRVSFDKSMTLSSGREMIDTTDNVYYFVLQNGSWLIADIR
ncbi:MAG: hypothetical protein K2K20_00980 [Lachnospiraceae bacterium]|nr:hypothetical protein [Lachnospiraceae bacterium]